MPRIIFPLFLMLAFYGCATTQSTKPVSETNIIEKAESIAEELKQQPTVDTADAEVLVQEEIEGEGPLVPTGIVFGKVNFTGVLNKSYALLSIKSLSDESTRFNLTLGDRKQDESLPWQITTTEAGYFFMELPEGAYQMTDISIPVSSTLAVEPINILFNARVDAALYIGDLMIEGTKEKINWGGIPVIKPGFEYEAKANQNTLKAFEVFRQTYPEFTGEPGTDFMVITPVESEVTTELIPQL